MRPFLGAGGTNADALIVAASCGKKYPTYIAHHTGSRRPFGSAANLTFCNWGPTRDYG
ncbi:hypothetical protein SPHINGOAX6_50206 [Sphingomonas sp. AX6]|nr:hypothetical protein SPHINGOAX6_50206 [Sphingomonas sp. AX6]